MSVFYTVRFFAYYLPYGINLAENLCKSEARNYVASLLRNDRNDGFEIITLERGKQWEILEPEDCLLVPDVCGILEIDEYQEITESEINFWEEYDIMMS